MFNLYNSKIIIRRLCYKLLLRVTILSPYSPYILDPVAPGYREEFGTEHRVGGKFFIAITDCG